MDAIQQTTQSQAVTNSNQAPSSTEGTSALSSDFETFLLMLTTQMENQDPLNPIESQDFAVQLATFSGVEQQVRTNELLESLSASFGGSGISQLASWVGMEARVAAPAAFDGTPLTLAPSPDPGSDSAILVVSDASGQVVSREQVPLGADTIQWAGVDNTGVPLPPGTYNFALESINQGTLTSTKTVEHYAMIEEARSASDGVEVVVRGGSSLPSSSVTALRQPPSSTNGG